MKRLLRLDCKFCGAVLEKPVDNDDAMKVEAVLWFRKHKPCSGGKPIRFNITGQTDKNAPLESLGSFSLKR